MTNDPSAGMPQEPERRPRTALEEARALLALDPTRKLPGTLKQRQRLRMLARQGGRCCYCPEPLGKKKSLSAEHVLERARGGPNMPYNRLAAHMRCNSRVGGWSVSQKLALMEQVDAPPLPPAVAAYLYPIAHIEAACAVWRG